MFMACNSCDAWGIRVMYSKKNQAMYAFVCDCGKANGRGYSIRIPRWSSKYSKDFSFELVKPEPEVKPKPEEDCPF